MIILDTSLWIEFLRRRTSEDVKRFVRQSLNDRTAAYTCPVAMELLSGCRDATEASVIRELLGMGVHLKVEWAHWARAAQIVAALHRKGLRVPLSDVLTAAVGVEERLAVVCRDKHFEVIRDHGGQALDVQYIK